jgi:nucleoside-diphosphate-sugar epimerase
MAGADAVLLLAGIIRAPDEATLLADNLGIVRQVVRAYEVSPEQPPLFFTSSLWVYEPSADPLGADSPTGTPRGPYGAMKLACERELAAAAERLGFPLWIGRASNLISVRTPRNAQSFVANMHDSLHERGVLEVRGDPVRDLVCIADLAHGLERRRASTAAGVRIENVCSGRGLSLADIAGAALERWEASGRSAELQVHPAAERDIMVGVPSDDRVWGEGPSLDDIARLIVGGDG